MKYNIQDFEVQLIKMCQFKEEFTNTGVIICVN